jgi:LPS-assembly lipoprotein
MWWPDKPLKFSLLARVAAVFALGGLCAGCFQPLYGENSAVNGTSVRDKLSGVDVRPVDAPNGTPAARLGVEVRNSLIFDFTQGAGKIPAGAATHALVINLAGQAQNVIVDTTTARPDVMNYGIDAVYTLTDLNTKQIVIRGRAFSRVSYDIPGQEQRFAGARALRDAEDRASKVLAEQIKNRLASYFLAGT